MDIMRGFFLRYSRTLVLLFARKVVSLFAKASDGEELIRRYTKISSWR